MTAALLAALALAAGNVPFVGCPSDGQQGPLPAPPSMRVPRVAPELAGRLAFYSAGHEGGVLAPRGWHCFGLYGSNGSILFVAPVPLAAAMLLERQTPLEGPAIQLTFSDGGTSGRFAVAEAIARLFPEHMDFVRRVASEGIVPDFPTGPYPGDTIERLSSTELRFVTPAGQEGLGTHNRFAPGAEPVEGLVILAPDPEEPNLVKLDLRLPGALRELAPAILAAVRASSRPSGRH